MNRLLEWKVKPERIIQLLIWIIGIGVLVFVGCALLAFFNVFDALGYGWCAAVSEADKCLRRKDYDGAIRASSRAIRLNGPSGDAYLLRGRAWEAKGDLDQAILDYGKAIRDIGIFDSALAHRGRAREKAGKVDEAISDYCRAIRANRYNVRGLRACAQVRAEIQDKRAVADMILMFDKAIERDPNNEDLRLCRRILQSAN